MKTKDNTLTNAQDVTISQEFLNEISNKNIEELETSDLFLFPPKTSDTDDLDASHFLLISNIDAIRTTNVMGVIGYKEEQLFIGSRFDNKNDHFFYYMLKKALNLNVINTDVSMEHQNSYLELLIFLFPKFLNNAMKKGLYKEYKVRQHNDTNVKGLIDFKRHLKENTPFLGKIAYNTREFSFENHVIHLIRYTIEFIKKRENLRRVLYMDDTTQENIHVVEKNSLYFDSLNVSRIIHHNIRKPVRHGYYYEYQALQKLCIAILRGNKTNYFNKNSKHDVYGILFDGAWLFEEYINTIIGDEYFHPQNTKGLGRYYLFNNSNGLIYPDFIGKSESNRKIADAKYKPISNIRGRDYLQIVAYAHRFEAVESYFIYPFQQNIHTDGDKTLSLLKGVNQRTVRDPEIKVNKLGIKIPSYESDFETFEKLMAEEELKLKNKMI